MALAPPPSHLPLSPFIAPALRRFLPPLPSSSPPFSPYPLLPTPPRPPFSSSLTRTPHPRAFSSLPSSIPDSSSSSSPSLSDILWPSAGAFVAMAAMSSLDKLIAPMGLTFTIAPFGAVCAVLFAAPHTPAAKKYNMFVAHIGCAALGVAALALFGQGWLARGTSLAASLAFMQLTGSLHPPAAGLPLLFIDVPKFQQLQWWYIIFPSAIGCALLCLLQEAVTFVKRTCRF